MGAAEPIPTVAANSNDYARCIEISKKVRWDIDADVIRGRQLDTSMKFLPDGLSLVNELSFLSEGSMRLFSQVQGRSYANIFGLVERFINCKVLEISSDHCLGDQTALEALVRFSDEELKHQELFRRVEGLADAVMPPGYRTTSDPNAVANAVLSKSTWSVLALTCHIEIFTQVHFKQSIEDDENLSPLWKDVFLYHWKEECQHAVLDELEWRREDARLSAEQRDKAVDDLIDLVVAVDGILQTQSAADAEYFIEAADQVLADDQASAVRDVMLKAYRWQYIVSGIQDGRFLGVLLSMLTEQQAERITDALGPLM